MNNVMRQAASHAPSKWLLLLAVCIPTITIEMAGTSVFVALEAITSDLGVSIERSVWLTTMYLVTNAMMLPLAGWLGSRLGYKRTIVLSMAVFTISALLGSLARNFEALVFFRALQGMGDGPILPIVTALLLEAFPEKERGKMMAVYMLAVSAAPVLAPLLASQVVHAFGWRGIFYLSVFLGLVAISVLWALLPNVKVTDRGVKLNWPLFLLLAAGTGSLQLFLDRGQHYGWFYSQFMLVLFVVAAVTLVLFLILTVWLKDRSVLDLSTLQDIPFLAGNIANMIVMGVLYGAFMIKILYLQWLMGYTTAYIGLYQALLVGVMLLFSIVAGFITDKIHPRLAVLLGLPVAFYGMLLASRLTLHNDMTSILTAGAILAAGIAFIMVPMSVTLFASISQAKMSAASVINSYLSVISMSIAMSLVMTFLIRGVDVHAVRLAQAIRIDNLAVARLLHEFGRDSGTLVVLENILLQSTMLSFNEVLYALAFALFLLLLYLPFMNKAKPEGLHEHNQHN